MDDQPTITPQSYFEQHVHPSEPYWEVGTMHNAFIGKSCGDNMQVYLMADGRIVDSAGRPFASLLRPHLTAKRHIPQPPVSAKPQEPPTDDRSEELTAV